MDFFERAFSLYGAFFANLLLLAAMSSTLSGQWCEALLCRGGHAGEGGTVGGPAAILKQAWQPYVDNPGTLPGSRLNPACPEPEATDGRTWVIDAELPKGFDPSGYMGRKLYACVKVDDEGRVAAARLIAGTGHRVTDRALVRAMTGGGWRFAAPEESSLRWQRVRLDAGPPDGEVIRFFPLY